MDYQQVLSAIEKLGYLLDKRDNYPNLIGIRKYLDNNNLFNDFLFVIIYKDNGNQIHVTNYPITTDPGRYYLLNPCNSKGTAIVKEGQYNNLWGFGLHNGKYPALVQVGKITVYRDNDKDAILDIEKAVIDFGYFGINLHHAGNDSNTVDNWSAGCQVFKKTKDFDEVYNLCKTSGFKLFNYILINDKDL
jgi:hypothetical protein